MVPGAPESHELQRTIDALHSRYKPLTDGDVASYIPELTKADPEHFGICIATAEGAVFETGDCDRAFTIQSISKPFTFGMAIEAYGARDRREVCRRRAERRRVQLDRAHERNEPAAQPDDQRRRDHRVGAAARALRRRGVRPDPRAVQHRGGAPARRSIRTSTSRSGAPATATARSRICCSTSASCTTPRSGRSTSISSSARFS